MTLEQQALQYLKDYYHNHPGNEEDKSYRIEHTLRVAAIGKEIAQKENLNEQAVILGCLLHDIGKYDCEANKDHGRASAIVARPFLESQALPSEVVDEICHGIATHVDGKADDNLEDTILSDTISDCDNIDRFDAIRVYQTIQYMDELDNKPIEERITILRKRIARLHELYSFKMATKTASVLFQGKLDIQLAYYQALLTQLESTYSLFSTI